MTHSLLDARTDPSPLSHDPHNFQSLATFDTSYESLLVYEAQSSSIGFDMP